MTKLNKQAFLSTIIFSLICLLLLGPVPCKVTVQQVFAQSLWQDGDIIYVDKNARGNGSGTSWNNAFNTIQAAIQSVDAGTQVSIFVTQGVYLEHNLVLQEGIKIYGSFAGYETSLAERGDVWTNNHWTVIDAERLHRVLNMRDKTEVNGFILRNGLRDYTLQSNTTLDDSRGGGIYIECDDDVVVRNNIIEDCAVYWQGGGIFIEGSCNRTSAAPLIEFNVIRSCTGYCGGGIEIAGVPEYAPGGTDAIIRHNVLRNNADGGTSELGFGLELWTEYEDQCSPRMGDFYNNIIIGFANQRGNIWAEDVHVWARNTTDRSFISTSWSLGELLYSGCYRYGDPDNYNIFGSDPMFVDEANSNYHLRAGSPCIGTGRGGVNIGLFPYNGDTQAPVISNVTSSGITSSGTTITWTTNEVSDSQVQYGLTTSYGSSTPLNTSLVTSHSVALSGLSAGTTYHYRVKSKDGSGNLATSQDYTFTTALLPDTTAPVISNVASSGITSSGATITWTTNEVSDSQVEYGLTSGYGSNTTPSTSLVTNHSVILSGLTASTTYHYQVRSKDASTNSAVSGDYIFTTSAQPPASWDGYGYRRPITIDYTKVTPCSSNLSNFPVLVTLSGIWLKTTGNGGSIYSSNGYDIIFKALDGSTKLNHEVEKYDGSTGTLVAWVRVPTLSYTTNTTIYIYYGNSGISTDQSNPTGVWDSNFVAVWHLREDPSITNCGSNKEICDSTSSALHADMNGAMTSGDRVSAKGNGGLDFDGSSNDYFNHGDVLNSLTLPFTVEAWVRHNGSATNQVIFASDAGANYSGFWFHIEGTTYELAISYGDNLGAGSGYRRSKHSTTTIPTATWTHVAAVVRGATNMDHFINGALSGGTYSGTGGTMAAGTSPATMGARGTNYFNGIIDEVRISAVDRGACWIGTSHNSQNSPSTFSTLGNEESPPTGDTVAPTVPTNLTAAAVSSTQINLSWTASTDNVGVTGYRVYRDGSEITTTTGTSYQNTGLSPSTTYAYRVAAYDAAGNVSTQSSQASATTQAPPDTQAPTVPTGLTATAVSSTQINLSWAASTDNVGVTGYRIYRDGSQISTTANTSYQDTGLSPSTTYTYRVAAYDAAGNVSAQSIEASATTPATPDTTPPVISNVASTGITSSGATITWSTNEASDSQVEYGLTTSYGSSTTLNTSLVTNHSVALSGLSASATYHYRVKSKDATANAAVSGDYSCTTSAPPDTTPPVISSVASSGVTSSGATITWTTNEASDSQVEYGLTTSYGSSTTLNTSLVMSHSVALSGLSASTTYHYRVKSKDAAGNLATSGDYSFTTSAPPDTTPPVISSVASSVVTSSGATITWTTNEASDSQVEYGLTTSYGSSTTLNTSMVTSHSVALSGLTASTTYHYRVKSKDAAANAAVSGDYTFTTSPTPDTKAPTVPTGLTATVISSTRIDLSWTASTDNVGVGGYKIYQNNIQIGTTASTSYQSTGLTANTSYTYRVAAYDGAENTSAKSLGITTKTQPSPSTMFTIGDRVQTTSNATVRSAPSSSGKTSGTQLKGAMGRVAGSPWYWNLQWWWQIDFDSGVDGWVAQGKLKKVVP